MASLTVQAILTRVQRAFGDSAGVQIDQTDIIRWINDAQREIVMKNQLLQAIGTTAVVAGQTGYSLPADLLTLRSIKVDGNKLRPLTLSEAETAIPDFDSTANYPSGTPTHFWIWANSFTVYPAPTSVNLQFKIYYTRQPADIANLVDTPELPVQYHNRIVEYCLQQAYELDENWAASQAKAQQFDQGVNQLKDNIDWAERDFYPSITSTDVELTGWYQ